MSDEELTLDDLAEAYAFDQIGGPQAARKGEPATAYAARQFREAKEWARKVLSAELDAVRADELDRALQAACAYGMPRDLESGFSARLAQLRGHGALVYAEPEGPELITKKAHAAELRKAKAAGWDEGFDAGWDEREDFAICGAIPSGKHQSVFTNPYRDQIEEDQ